MGFKMQLSSKDLRFHTKSALDAVKRGEQVDITFHGKVAAVMVAPENIEKSVRNVSIDDISGFGMWADREDMTDVNAYIRNLRKPRYQFNAD